MTYVFRTKYAAFLAALVIGVSDVYADSNCVPITSACTDICDNSCCGTNAWVSADVLYLRASEDGFGCDFGSTTISTAVDSGIVVTNIVERDRDIDFDWDVGFRLGAGYALECSCWDIDVYWMHFYQNSKGHECNNRADWKLRFDEVDAILGYNLTYGDCFRIRPFFGARYARINQKLTTFLEAEILTVATGASSLVLSEKRNNEHFWGAGPLIGFEADFFLGCGWSVYGNLSGNLLYGSFKSRFNDSDIFATSINNCFSHSRHNGVLTGFDAGLGIRYEICNFTLQLGLEHHDYFDYNKIGCVGDLNLYGFNASVGYRF